MPGWMARRLLGIVLAGLVASLLVCMLTRLIPGDPIVVLLKNPTPELVARLRSELGLDRPWYEQYAAYLGGIVTGGDFGRSLVSGRDVADDLRRVWPATLELACGAMVVATGLGVCLGSWAARRAGSRFDTFWTVVSLGGVSIPVFWLGLMLLVLFTFRLQWLPTGGRLAPETAYEPVTGLVLLDAVITRRGALLADGLRHLLLPTLTLATIPAAFIARITRSAVIESLHQPYIVAAQAKGVEPRHLLYRHALRPALIPIVTMVGLEFSYLLGGAVLTETVFAWPGVGRYVTDAVLARDYPAVQGALFVLIIGVMAVQLAVDLVYARVNPRVQALLSAPGGGGPARG